MSGPCWAIAPPGYGKTVLLAEVAEATRAPLLWLQLDDADNDPAAFVAALAEGAAKAFPELRSKLAGLGSAEQGGVGAGGRALTAIVNALIDASVEEWTLVIDDLHLLSSPGSLALIERLVDFPPPGMRLLIASRIARRYRCRAGSPEAPCTLSTSTTCASPWPKPRRGWASTCPV